MVRRRAARRRRGRHAVLRRRSLARLRSSRPCTPRALHPTPHPPPRPAAGPAPCPPPPAHLPALHHARAPARPPCTTPGSPPAPGRPACCSRPVWRQGRAARSWRRRGSRPCGPAGSGGRRRGVRQGTPMGRVRRAAECGQAGAGAAPWPAGRQRPQRAACVRPGPAVRSRRPLPHLLHQRAVHKQVSQRAVGAQHVRQVHPRLVCRRARGAEQDSVQQRRRESGTLGREKNAGWRPAMQGQRLAPASGRRGSALPCPHARCGCAPAPKSTHRPAPAASPTAAARRRRR